MTPEQEQAMEFHLHEMDIECGKFTKWARLVERILGHDLDGCQEENGYSLDAASDAFDEGHSPEFHAQSILKSKSYRRAE